jgi:hypothetical protein
MNFVALKIFGLFVCPQFSDNLGVCVLIGFINATAVPNCKRESLIYFP